jgi:CheY-like chemotaxis protein
MPNMRRILIVDDDPELREALMEELSLHEEFETVAVDSGSRACTQPKPARSISSS